MAKRTTKRPNIEGVITDVRLTRMRRGDVSYPAIFFEGPAPEKDIVITVRLENGALYTGKVLDATEADGQCYVEFYGGLKPV